MRAYWKLLSITLLSFWAFLFFIGCNKTKESYLEKKEPIRNTFHSPKIEGIDTADYNKRMKALNNFDTSGKWNFKSPYPLAGALLPFNRVVAFYGNLYSKKMGILGELPKDKMLKKLQEEVAQWQAADPNTKTIPALHYIAVSAQSKPGKSGKYRLRMPFRQIDTIIAWSKKINAIVFLDIQIGQSNVEDEIAAIKKYLKLPFVHLALDPEFAMKKGEIPGTKIGTLSSEQINTAVNILINIVKENKIPPKILVIHRFTKQMITDYQKIKTVPEVQIVINMDGFGNKNLKKSSYFYAIYKEPVQFTGFKLFYKNDTKGNRPLYTPTELLNFKPKPIYIQYQ